MLNDPEGIRCRGEQAPQRLPSNSQDGICNHVQILTATSATVQT